MDKIVTITQAAEISQKLHKEGKAVVLTGGCFDILHLGHFRLFQKAKQQGDFLFVLLESDKKIQALKGSNRPLHNQHERAEMLAGITYIDHVIPLPFIEQNKEYDQIVSQIHPSIIAITEGDPGIEHKKRQAEKIDAKLIEVVKYIPNKSTSATLEAILAEK